MKNKLPTIVFLISAWASYSQVGIGTTIPNKSSQLHLVADDKGILIPQVPLKSITDNTTIKNKNVNSLLVFNTTTNNNLLEGYYYWSERDKKWLKILDSKYTSNGSVVYFDGDKFTYINNEGIEITITVKELVKLNETITTLTKGAKGTYTYTSENGTVTVINVPDDVINNFEQIINNETVKEEIINVIKEIGGNVYYDGNSFTYLDQTTGEVKNINISELVKLNETITTLTKGAKGTYTYTSENGTVTVINVPDDVINNFEQIINNETVKEEIINVIKEIGGNVYYDGNSFTYLDQTTGEVKNINISELVKLNETITTLTKGDKGTYTYTSENGTVTVINVPDDVINNFEQIINNETVKEEIINVIKEIGGNVYYDGNSFTYLDQTTGEVKNINISELVKLNETITTLTKGAKGTYTYTSENGTVTVINVPDDVINNFEQIINNETVKEEIINVIKEIGGNVYYDGNSFTYLDQTTGEVKNINISELVKLNETITTLTKGAKGTYTYTSENGTVTVINVPDDVINNFEQIINNETVKEEIINVIKEIGGNVYYDGNSFTYLDQTTGEVKNINISELVKLNETITTLTKGAKGTYTYTSENGTVTVINVPDDVINNFEQIINNETVKEEIINVIKEIGGNVYYDGNSFTYLDQTTGEVKNINISELVKLNETITTLTKEAKGTYTYTSENGTVTVINVPDDVINNFEQIINNETVKEEIINVIKEIGGNVYYDGNSFTYLDQTTGEVKNINISELVKLNETITTLTKEAKGTYTYTSENGTVTVINVPDDVINNFEQIINNETVKEEIINVIKEIGGNVYYDGNSFTYLDQTTGEVKNINISELVKLNETITTLTKEAKGTYTYTSENGTVTVIYVPDDVINNFEQIINNETVKEEIINVIKEIGGNVYYDGNSFTYLDQTTGEVKNINISELVKLNETITTLTKGAKGTYTYTSENGTVTVINVPDDVINNFEQIINNETVKEEIINVIKEIGGNVYYDGNSFTYLDQTTGEVKNINISELVKLNETITTLTKEAKGTYTYTSENGTVTVINVPDDVINNFEQIINNETVKEEIINVIKEIGGNVYYDGNSFTYLDQTTGEVKNINISELVKLNETITTLTKEAKGTYTYTSENGTVTVINVPDDVINNFEQIINNETVKEEIINVIKEIGGNVYYDGNSFTYLDQTTGEVKNINISELVKLNETITTLTKEAKGTYTYTSENGTVTVIYVPDDVINNFEQIINNETVKEEIINVIKEIGGNVYYDGNSFTYLDQTTGEVKNINISELVKLNETITTLTKGAKGTYTYTSENGTVTVINVPDDVINNFEQIINNETIKDQIIEVIEVNGKDLTGTGITVTDGVGAMLKSTKISITPGTKDQVLTTNEAENGTVWRDLASIITQTTNELSKEGENKLISNVSGEVSSIDNIVSSVANSITGTKLKTTVNGVNSVDLDLKNVIEAGQKTVTIADGINTTVEQTTSGNNTEYTVNVSNDVIQQNQKTTVVAAGDGVVVSLGVIDNETTYTVAADPTSSILRGDVSGSINNNKVEKIQGISVVNTVPITDQVLTFDGTNWVPTIPTVNSKDIVEGQALTSTDLDFEGQADKSLLKDVKVSIKNDAVTSTHIKNGTILPEDIANAGKNQVLITGEDTKPKWGNQTDLVAANNGITKTVNNIQLGGDLIKPTVIKTEGANTLAISGLEKGTIDNKLVVADNEGVLKHIKSSMPKFFYMPSILLDTENLNDVITIDLYSEYKAQFSSIVDNKKSIGAPTDIPFIPNSSELYYYITYSDDEVVEINSVTADGIMTYKVVGEAKSSSFVNIVFVVKD